MKKLLFILPLFSLMVFTGAMCTTNTDTATTTTNTAPAVEAVELEPMVTLDKTVYAPGEEIEVTIANYEDPADTAWVGVIAADVAHGDEALNDENDIDYEYVVIAINGMVYLNAPMEVGEYTVRLNSADSGDEAEEVAYESFTVEE